MTKIAAGMEKVKDIKVVNISSHSIANKFLDRKHVNRFQTKNVNVGYCPSW